MSRSQFHLSFSRTLLLCMIACLPLFAMAQEDSNKVIEGESSPVTDTVITTEENANETGNYFLAVQDGSSMQDSLQLRRIPDSVTARMKKDDDFWYADKDFRKKKEIKEEEEKGTYKPLLERVWFRTLLWLIVIGGFVAFIIWYLSGNEFGLFRKRPRSFSEDPALDEAMPENIFEINYQRELEKAIARGDYRLGVRLLYLHLLKRMAEKNVITYKQDKTNSDYLFSLLSTRYYDGYFRMTRHYEYTWYGHFDVSEEAFGIIRREFDQFQKQHL